jgi:UDP-N-acetylmuramoyl-tripeptide--D-alanyl-D-alanine ligase
VALQLGVEEFFAFGKHSCRAAEVFGKRGFCFSDKALMAEFIAQRLNPDVTLLIKGSRSAGMDELVRALCAESRHPGGKHAV